MERSEVYKLIDGERDYQDAKWNAATTTSKGLHGPTEWLVYIEDYVNEAKHIVSREYDPIATEKAMSIMRKIGAMAVAAMEQNEAPVR